MQVCFGVVPGSILFEKSETGRIHQITCQPLTQLSFFSTLLEIFISVRSSDGFRKEVDFV
jgi:hypothetical protein